MPSLERIFGQVLGRNGVDAVVARVRAGEEPEQITLRSLMNPEQYNSYRRTVEAIRMDLIGSKR